MKMKEDLLGENYKVQNRLGMCNGNDRESSFLIADYGEDLRDVQTRPDEELEGIAVQMDD